MLRTLTPPPRASTIRSYMQFGLAAEIGDENADLPNAVRGAKIEILRWVYRAVGLGRPDFVDVASQFENNDRPGVKFGVANIGKTWVAKVEHSDRAVHDRYWTTEVCVVENADSALLGVRNVCTSGPDVIKHVPVSTPAFVRFFAKRIGLLDAEAEISTDAWHVQDERDIDNLYNLVVNPERFLPVILVTEPYRIDVEAFAWQATGVAHVVALSDSLTHAWTERITKEMSAYLGAIRTYNPDVDLRDGSPFDHPRTLGGRVAAFVAPDGSVGGKAYADWLLRKAYRVGANRILRDKRFPRFTEIRAARLVAQRQEARGSADEPMLIEIAEQEVEQYKLRAQEAQQMQDEALSENKLLTEDVRAMRSQALSMQIRIDSLVAALHDSGRQEPIEIPGDLRNLKTWAEKHLSGHVYLLPRALSAARDSEYEHPEDIYNALLWLAQYYWPSKTAEEPDEEMRERSRARLAELGFEYAGAIEERLAGDEYYANYGGERRFMNMALKKGNSREARYCMRIYTFWDEDAQATIVGHLPSHLDNRMS